MPLAAAKKLVTIVVAALQKAGRRGYVDALLWTRRRGDTRAARVGPPPEFLVAMLSYFFTTNLTLLFYILRKNLSEYYYLNLTKVFEQLVIATSSGI